MKADCSVAWQFGLGALLYAVDGPTTACESRSLWHVTARYVDVDSGIGLYELYDATHTSRRTLRADELLEEYAPAGWTCRPTMPPAHLLLSQHGVRHSEKDRGFDDYLSHGKQD